MFIEHKVGSVGEYLEYGYQWNAQRARRQEKLSILSSLVAKLYNTLAIRLQLLLISQSLPFASILEFIINQQGVFSENALRRHH